MSEVFNLWSWNFKAWHCLFLVVWSDARHDTTTKCHALVSIFRYSTIWQWASECDDDSSSWATFLWRNEAVCWMPTDDCSSAVRWSRWSCNSIIVLHVSFIGFCSFAWCITLSEIWSNRRWFRNDPRYVPQRSGHDLPDVGASPQDHVIVGSFHI